MRVHVAILAAAVATTSGCGTGYAQRGESLYREARYVEAAEVFERTEARLGASEKGVCAEYGLYRGLTFLRLDDLPSARQWLSYVHALEQKTPGLLGEAERILLERGWAELQQRQKAAPPPEAPGRVAATDGARGTVPASNGRRSIATE